MDDLSKIVTLLPFVRAKIDELGLGIVATQALEKWRSDVMSMPQFAGRPMSAPLPSPNLSKELSKVTLSELCVSTLLPDGVAERTERLLMELRVVASVARRLTTVVPTALGHD
jgi:hypothetical protein